MIAVSEPPLEFVPRGRQAAEEHPGPTEPPPPRFLPAEHILLQRLQNVNISAAAAASEEPQEFWSIREIYDDYETSYARAQRRQQLIEQTKKCGPKAAAATQLTSLPQQLLQPIQSRREDPMCDYIVNNEEELYVNKNTVIWTQGLNDDDDDGVHKRMCFTCDTPVKFACFLSRSFVRGRLAQLRAAVQPEEDTLTAICVVDQDALRVYCDDGEDYLANLDFPVSHLWQTAHGLLLEKDSGNALVSHLSIPMPRLFSMSHPLHEACPVILKTTRNSTGYMTEPEYSVVFTAEDSDLVLLYDAKFFKHFVARLRKVTPEEVNNISQQQQELLNQTLQGHRDTPGTNSFSSTKLTGGTNKTLLGRNNNSATPVNNFSRFGMSQSQSFSGVLGQSNRASLGTPLSQLHNSISQQSASIKDMRKITHVKPAKPIEPEMCLDHIWTENTFGTQREFCEMATRAFIHTDLVGQTYLCYLLPRSCRLQLVLVNGYDTKELQLSTLAATLNAKDAVALQRLHMIAVLDPGGSLILYTGTVLISKVHITPLLTTAPTVHVQMATSSGMPTPTQPPAPPSSGAAHHTPVVSQLKVAAASGAGSSSFVEVRRSSLLPTKVASEFQAFDEELHMLSPIQPQAMSYTQRQAHNVCKALRDPAGNRLTLVYATGRMLRIALPLLNDTRLITRCIAVLRQVLNPGQFLHFIIRWYSARNPPGSRDYSIEQEWQLFRSTLLSLMGCMAATAESTELEDGASSSSYPGGCATPPPPMHISFATAGLAQDEPKKRRKYNDCEAYTDEDWEFLVLQTTLTSCLQDSPHMYSVDVTAPLFCSLPAIFYGLHMLYEDLKLDSIFQSGLNYLATFLHQLAIDMQLDSYILHYHLDFPELTQKTTKLTMLSSEHGALMLYQELLRMPAPSIYAQLEHVLRAREEVAPYSYVECINERSRNVIQLISLVLHGHHKLKHWWHLLEHFGAVQTNYPKRPKRSISADVPRCHQVLELLLCMQMTRRDIARLPAAVHLVLAEALEQARLTPPVGSSMATYELILRPELSAHAQLPFLETALGQPHCGRVYKEDSLSPRLAPSSGELPMAEPDADHLRHDGMDNMDTKLLRLRFPDDMRVEEVRRLLNSADPVSIEVTQSPGISDHEFIEEQEKQLFALCARTMTLPLGRGMFTLRTLLPRPSDNMPMPKLCLAGREPIKGTTIEMQQIEFPANMHQWPSFHNGVATGLKISPQALDIDSTWIVYNKPKTQANNALEHAGFLMALGLNGHLRSLSFMSIFKYLVKCDEMTSVGLLLGISAAHRGSMDTKTTKLLSVHLEALLPATAMELDIPQSTQVAALMGIGLLYQGSAKRHIAEVLLQEIGRPPGPEMENSVERESYAMTAGLSLGLVTLGQGESPAGLRDLQLPDTLHYYMVGGVKRPIGGSQKEKYRLASFQVREGDNVNIDVTAPGATLALGLMFFGSGNEAVAEWMRAPDSRYLLDMVRPDFLLLRTIARGLILWDQVQPDNDWFQSQFPEALRPHLRLPSREDQPPLDTDVDYEAITQAYCNILAGAAFCIGLKFAGTENPQAFATLRAVIKEFLSYPGTLMGEFAGRSTTESCLMVLLISISLVFAGSGNCEILRIIRYLRSRVGPHYPHITYGSHMAIHMSLGLLFLGAGRYTISKTPESIAALVCAFFPKFPIHSNDNRYHLQALRHLYVLAVEPRLFLPRDIDTNQLCLCNISVLEVGANVMRRLPIAPCILPELSTLEQVIVDDENYWPVCFERTRNWHQLEKALELCAPIDIKKRTGCLSHLEDPDRLKSMLAQTLTMEQSICWQVDVNDLQQFASERLVKPFLSRFLDTKGTSLSYLELSKRHQLMLLFYNAVVKDRMHLLPVYLTLYDHVTKKMANNNDVWQVKLLEAYLSHGHDRSDHALISVELIQMMQEMFKLQLEDWTREQCLALREYLSQKRLEPSFVGSISAQDLQRVFCIINYFNLMPNLLCNVDLSTGPVNYLRIMLEFNKLQLNPHTIYGLLKIFQALASICESEEEADIDDDEESV